MRPLLVGFGIGLILIAIFAFVVQRGDEAADSTTTSTLAASPSVAPTITLVTPQTTTSPATATTATPSTTSVAPPIPATFGDAIPVSDLDLAVNFMGPLDFGEPGDEVVGRLIATFGAPDSYQALTGALGLCPDEEGIGATWGPLGIILADGQFAGYRLDSFAPEHPASEIVTLSGLKVGDTVERLRSIYSGLTVDIVEDDLRFELKGSDGSVLLWGPVTSADSQGVVDGIYSPNPCDGGAG